MNYHTLPPWDIGRDSLVVRSSDRMSNIADCGVSYTLQYAEMRANAVLISAAPDMLEALESISNCETSMISYDSWDKLKSAIAKAKGGIK